LTSLLSFFGNILLRQQHDLSNILDESMRPGKTIVADQWLSYLDVRNYHAIEKEILEFKPTIIFHLAALTDLEYCEENPLEAYKTNAFGTENVVILVLTIRPLQM